MAQDTRLAVVAVGGNSLIKDKQHQTVPDQYAAAQETGVHIAGMIAHGWDVAIGPRAGNKPFTCQCQGLRYSCGDARVIGRTPLAKHVYGGGCSLYTQSTANNQDRTQR